MPKIKPCKCGYSAVLKHTYASIYSMYYVECTNCGLKTKEYSSTKKAIKAWNKKYENIRINKNAG